MNLTGKIIAGLLTLLGFTGCDINITADEYGSPHAGFEVKGRVVDEAGEALKDIKITVRDDDWDDPEHPLAIGITDANGYYGINGSWHGGRSLSVSTEDIDGDKNGGEFAPQTQELEIKNGDYVGGDGWYRGGVVLTADFKLILRGDAVDAPMYGVVYARFEPKPHILDESAEQQ